MKKIFAMVALAAAAVCGTAQAGDGFIGGRLGYTYQEQGGVTTNSFAILPELGYNFNNKWAIGTTIGYDYKHTNKAKIDSNLFEFNPYSRYSFYRSSNNLVQLFVDGSVGIGLGWVSYNGNNSDTAVTWNIGLRPGVALNFTDSFSMVAHVGFLGYQGANDAAMTAGYARKGGFWLNGNNLTLGFYYNF